VIVWNLLLASAIVPTIAQSIKAIVMIVAVFFMLLSLSFRKSDCLTSNLSDGIS
jgi:hypothetical protein